MADDEIENFERDLAKRRELILTSHAIQLAEHFDSVQIITTTIDAQDGSLMHCVGVGQHYARVGAVDEWLRRVKRGK